MKRRIFSIALFMALFAGVSYNADAHKHSKYCKHGKHKHHKHHKHVRRGHAPAPVVSVPHPSTPPAPHHPPAPPRPPMPPAPPLPR